MPHRLSAEKLRLDPEKHALFLDCDGTLADIRSHFSAVVIPDAVKTDLDTLFRKFSGAIAIVSGRNITGLDALLTPLKLPTAGLHGLEIRCNEFFVNYANLSAFAVDAFKEDVLTLIQAFPGVLVEDKRETFCVHYRQSQSNPKKLRAELEKRLAQAELPLEIHDGKQFFEFRYPDVHKGAAVKVLLQQPPFLGRTPCFIGDDVTDEDGFRAVNALGGLSIKVGVSPMTVAKYSLPNVPAVWTWLAEQAR